jgi:hypothetical protein
VADAPDRATLAQIVTGFAELLGVAVNVTDPAGVPEPLPDGDTVAVKVTLAFESCGFADDETTVVVGVTTD